MSKIIIAIGQMNSKKEDLEFNLQKTRILIKKAAEKSASLIILPELFSSGYRADNNFQYLSETTNGKTISSIINMAKEYNIIVSGSFPEINETNKKPFNTSFLIGPNGIIGKYQKIHLWGKEPEYFSSGDKVVLKKTDIGVIGMMICYDLMFPEMARSLALKGAKILICSMAFGPNSRKHILDLVGRTRSVENTCIVAISNRIGKEMDTEFCGNSGIFSPDGTVLCKLFDEEDVAVAEIDLDYICQYRKTYKYLEQRRRDVYNI